MYFFIKSWKTRPLGQALINQLINRCTLFTLPSDIFITSYGRQYCWCRAAKINAFVRRFWPLSWQGLLSCHARCDMGRSQTNDCLIKSSCMTSKEYWHRFRWDHTICYSVKTPPSLKTVSARHKYLHVTA